MVSSNADVESSVPSQDRRRMDTGHLFIVHGRLESVDADVVVVPTDEYFTVEGRWSAVWGGPLAPRPGRPASWSKGWTAPLSESVPADGPWLWFVDAAQSGGDTANRTIEKIVQGVTTIIRACAGLRPPRHNRVKPLIAMPTLGVGGGGLGGLRGELIAKLIDGASSAAERHNVDIVIVALRPSDHAAFQFKRRERVGANLSDELKERAASLGRRARSGELALSIAAGVSMSAGLPSWACLLNTSDRTWVSRMKRSPA